MEIVKYPIPFDMFTNTYDTALNIGNLAHHPFVMNKRKLQVVPIVVFERPCTEVIP